MRPALVVSLLLAVPVVTTAQTASTPQRDPQAITVLAQSIAAMGGTVPMDSIATGSVTIVAGSSTQSGTVRILTRGSDQTSEEITFSLPTSKIVHSRGAGSELQNGVSKRMNLQKAATSQCPDFPLPLLSAILNNSEMTLQYIGLETLNGASVHHVRSFDTLASRPRLQSVSRFTTKDIWIDAVSALPRKISFTRREADGAPSRFGIPVDVFFSDYRRIGSTTYPFQIKQSLNYSPWLTITVQNVSFSAGLTDSDFPVPSR